MQAISKLPRSVSHSGTRPSVIAYLTPVSYQQAGRHLPRTLQLKHEHARYLHPITLIPGARPGAWTFGLHMRMSDMSPVSGFLEKVLSVSTS